MVHPDKTDSARPVLQTTAKLQTAIDNHRIHNLQPLTEQLERLACQGPAYDGVEGVAAAYCDSYDKIEALKNALLTEQANNDLKWRVLMLSIDIPFLVDTLAHTPELLRHGYIADMGWWDNPAASSIWKDWQDLLGSSQKLQFVVKEALARKEMKTDVELRDGQIVRVKHYDKIIFAAREPLVAFCVYLVLLQSLADRYGGVEGAMDAIKVVWQGRNMMDVVNKFQLKSNGNTCLQPSVDIVVILSRVRTTGVLLTKADRLVMVDVDPDIVHNAKLKNLHHRFTQERDATFVQLVSDFRDIQEMLIDERGMGQTL